MSRNFKTVIVRNRPVKLGYIENTFNKIGVEALYTKVELIAIMHFDLIHIICMTHILIDSILERLNRPIILIGMMGAGKSHMGRALAKALGVKFYDSDKIIEEKAGRSIPDIFTEFGEEKFRDSEKKTILTLLEQPSCVIATGGGAVLNAETLHAIKEKGLVIWVTADIKTLMARVQKSNNRPLLQAENPQEILEGLLHEREALYAQAHIKMDTSSYKDKKSDALVLQDMLQAINENLKAR